MQCHVVDPQFEQRLPHRVERGSGGSDSEGRPRRVEFDDVESVCRPVRADQLCPGTVEIGLGIQAGRGCRHGALPIYEGPSLPDDFGDHRIDAEFVTVDRPGAVGHVGDELERHDASRGPRHRDAVDRHGDDFAGIAREEDRNAQGSQGTFTDDRQRRGLGGWVVAHQEQHPAARVGAVHVGVT